jgi:KaiC/GvpD/RAD55 family RecA-like ATPase
MSTPTKAIIATLPSALTTTSASALLSRQFAPRGMIIGPWLREAETALIWAATGVGKTMLTLSLAIAVASGGSVWEWSASKPRKVWIIDGEMHLQDLQERLKMLARTAVSNVNFDELGANLRITARQDQDAYSTFYDVTVKEHQDVILAKCKDDGIELLIIDNLTTVADSLQDENDATAFRSISSFMTRMKQAGIATILVHHARKDGKEARGSTALQTTFEVIVGLTRPQVPVHGKASFIATFGKFRGLGGPLTEARQWTLAEDGWSVTEDTEDRLNTVLAALQGLECVNRKELAERLGISQQTIGRDLQKLVALGKVTDDGIKGYFGRAKEFRTIDHSAITAEDAENDNGY